jgi:hypothetical protein
MAQAGHRALLQAAAGAASGGRSVPSGTARAVRVFQRVAAPDRPASAKKADRSGAGQVAGRPKVSETRCAWAVSGRWARSHAASAAGVSASRSSQAPALQR